MKAAGVFALICIAALSLTAKADGKCERFETLNPGGPLGTIKTCYMPTTAIDLKNFLITSGRDEVVKVFMADGNEQLKYLPNNLGAKFPNLLGLIAYNCSIKEVSKDNFKGLGELRVLWLDGNQIEKIDDDTFEYVPAVEIIDLQQNKIKKLNGRAFALLHKLTTVHMFSNDCIDENFDTESEIAELPRVVTEKCGFTESETSPKKIVENEAELLAPTESSAAKFLGGGGTWLICLGFLRLAKKTLL